MGWRKRIRTTLRMAEGSEKTLLQDEDRDVALRGRLCWAYPAWIVMGIFFTALNAFFLIYGIASRSIPSILITVVLWALSAVVLLVWLPTSYELTSTTLRLHLLRCSSVEIPLSDITFVEPIGRCAKFFMGAKWHTTSWANRLLISTTGGCLGTVVFCPADREQLVIALEKLGVDIHRRKE